MIGKRHFIVLLVVGLMALAPAQAGSASFVAHLKAPNHHPLANKLWYITVSATSAAGKPLKATAWYEFYYAGQKVATRNPSPTTPCDEAGGRHPYPFKGSYRDGLLWPKRSIGIPLTLKVAVKVKGLGIKRLSWKVVIRKSSYAHCTR
jgi:hypothetical protein